MAQLKSASKKSKKKAAKKSVAKTRKKRKGSTSAKSNKKTKVWHLRCHDCLAEIQDGTPHHCIPVTQKELFEDIDEDLRDAFYTLRERAQAFGEQDIYNNAKAVMFARRVCYMFVRPKKSYLELCFFLDREESHSSLHRVTAVSKSKFSHTFKLVHSDQLEEPLLDWLRHAYEIAE